MKRIFSILFALVLVLSFSLIPATPAAANGAPTVTLDMPENVYRPVTFDATSTTTNPTGGTSYTYVRFNITVSGPEAFPVDTPRADIFTITQVVPGGVQGINETFVLVGGDFVGYWGPEGGFPLPAGYGPITSTFTVQMNDGTTAPVGDYEVTVELVDLTDGTLASATDGFSLSADTLHVGAGQQFTTIQAAIDAANSGDTISVHTGTYPESVVISTNDITLQGEGNPVLDGTGLGFVNAITLSANGVTIRGFEIRDYGGQGIRADGTISTPLSGITLRHLNIHDVGSGGGHAHAIDIRHATDVIIQNVTVVVGSGAVSWAEAIRLESIDGVQVINVDVDGGWIGVNFALGDDPDGPTNGVIKGSTFANNGFIAVFIANSTSATVKGNTVEDAGMSGIYAGWAGAEVTGVVIQGNEVSGSSVYGITLGGASDSVVRGNEVSDSGVDGIALYPYFWDTRRQPSARQ